LRSCAAIHFVFATENIVTRLEFGKIGGGIRRMTDTSTPPLFCQSQFGRLARKRGMTAVAALRGSPFFRILKAMEVQLTPDQTVFARRAIETGRLHSERDAVQEALALWEERERQRTEFLLTLDEAKASLDRGEGCLITQESMQQLAREVKEGGRARLLAELTTSR
jgi:Arc/MetJ-type ribon-helix-helix transcriptional regulator